MNRELKLAMLGMIEGNGHPYSWSGIINGYNPAEMAKCPYAGIPIYMGRQPLDSVRIPGARVTHIWCDDPADAPPREVRIGLLQHVMHGDEHGKRVDARGRKGVAGVVHDLRPREARTDREGEPRQVDRELAKIALDRQIDAAPEARRQFPQMRVAVNQGVDAGMNRTLGHSLGHSLGLRRDLEFERPRELRETARHSAELLDEERLGREIDGDGLLHGRDRGPSRPARMGRMSDLAAPRLNPT